MNTRRPLALQLPDELLDAIAERVVERLAADTAPEPDGFLSATEAASFLACPVSRVYALVSARRIPVKRDGSRLLFERSELREYVKAGGARRP